MTEQIQTVEEKIAILARYNYPYEEFLKLEKLRGCPIELIDDNMTVEFDEYCSQELRKRQPFVTIWMLTYNHEEYIAEAIEGVVNQKCDFPIELIIVEDYSSDKTLDICKEYQKRYPGIIHLFTSRERKPFALARMLRTPKYIDQVFRGQYLAFCEGDDYWTDMKKLQKQVKVFDNYPDIGLCCTNYLIKEETTGVFSQNIQYPTNEINDFYQGLLSGNWNLPFQTAGVLLRMQRFKENYQNEFLYRCVLKMGDFINFFSSVFPSGMFFALSDVCYVYRKQNNGATFGKPYLLWIDGFVCRYYFMRKIYSKLSHDAIYLKCNTPILAFKYHVVMEKMGDWSSIKDDIHKTIYGISVLKNMYLIHQLQQVALWLSFKKEARDVSNYIYSEMRKCRIPMVNKNISHSPVIYFLSCFLPYQWVSKIWRLRRKRL